MAKISNPNVGDRVSTVLALKEGKSSYTIPCESTKRTGTISSINGELAIDFDSYGYWPLADYVYDVESNLYVLVVELAGTKKVGKKLSDTLSRASLE